MAWQDTVAQTVTGLGFDLVDLERSAGGLLRVTIDLPWAPPVEGAPVVAEQFVTVEDCETVSREVSAQLDVEDPITGNYTLEVSSPGVDRPLFRLEHYARFAGESAKVVMKLPQDGRRRLQGTIARIEGDRIVFVVDGAEMAVAFDNIDKARLVPDWAALGLAPTKPGKGKNPMSEPANTPRAMRWGWRWMSRALRRTGWRWLNSWTCRPTGR